MSLILTEIYSSFSISIREKKGIINDILFNKIISKQNKWYKVLQKEEKKLKLFFINKDERRNNLR